MTKKLNDKTGNVLENIEPVASMNGSVAPSNLLVGGYDGGLKIGWEGHWDFAQFPLLVDKLEAAQKRVQHTQPRQEYAEEMLCGVGVRIFSCGERIGNNYWKYKFCAFGVTFFVHQNESNPQQVRATYSTAALIYDALSVLHDNVLEFISSLGLTVTKETLTCVDMQVLIDEPVSTFMSLVDEDLVVGRTRGKKEFKDSGAVETYYRGSHQNVQIRIYDKRAQMKTLSTPQQALLIEHCIGQVWWNSERPITRVEVHFGRTTLKRFGVDSIRDLLRSERTIIDVATTIWFRILTEPQVRGKGMNAKIHPLPVYYRPAIDLRR